MRRINRLRCSSIAVALAVATISSACVDDSNSPLNPKLGSLQVVAADSDPFYYYQGQPVYLDLDPTRLVIASTLPSPETTITDVVGNVGLQVSSVTRLTQMRDHWLVRLPDATARTQAATARKQLETVASVTFASNAYTTRDEGHDVLLLDRLTVRFKDEVTRVQVHSLNAAFGTSILRPPSPDSGFTAYWLTYPRGADPLKVAAQFSRNPLVAWADPDKVSDETLATMSGPTDPYYNLQYYLKSSILRNGIPADINVEPAWALTTGASTVVVAVLDEGVDASHPDFHCTGIDTLPGHDEFSGYPFDGPYNPTGFDHHGTWAVGIFKACHDGVGAAGIAPGVTIRSVRIFREGDPTSSAKIADAINWAATRADVLSNSWSGGAWSNAIDDAIHTAASAGRGGKGAAVVFSAGNDSTLQNGPVQYPATLNDVIAVGALKKDGELPAYSATGPTLDIVAFGGDWFQYACAHGDIVTTDPVGQNGCNDILPNLSDQNYTGTYQGTSAAAPQVSGVIALLYSLDPTLTYAQVRSRLMNSANPWGPSNLFGAGKLNAYQTLIAAPAPLTIYLAGPHLIKPGATCTWWAVVSGGYQPYSYEWTGEIQPYGTTGQYYTGHKDPILQGPQFKIRLDVSENYRYNGAYALLTVHEDPDAPECMQ